MLFKKTVLQLQLHGKTNTIFTKTLLSVQSSKVTLKFYNVPKETSQEISLKKIYDEGYISRFFSKIIMISNHFAFVLLLFSSANFITDSNKYTIASKKHLENF